MNRIKEVKARKIFTSLGKPSIEIEAKSENGTGIGSCDIGLSSGKFEVNQFPKDINFLVKRFNENISRQMQNLTIEKFDDLEKVENIFKIFDITKNLDEIGGNVIVATESAVLKSISGNNVVSLLNPKAKKIPALISNIVGGGKHSYNKGADFQEFLVLPKTKDTAYAIEMSNDIFNRTTEDIMKRDKNFMGGRNLKNALSPDLINIEILDMLRKICDKVSKEYRIDVDLGVDIAGSQLWNGRRYEYKKYMRKDLKRNLSKEEQIDFVKNLMKNYNLMYVEDPLHEEDFDGFRELNKGFGVIAGDDLVSSRLERLENSVKKISAVVVKPNQIGSLMKLKNLIDFAKQNKIMPVFSHRSGNSNDDIIASLAVAWESPLIKTGMNNVNLLNSLLRIKENI